jgi:hypothetical protein
VHVLPLSRDFLTPSRHSPAGGGQGAVGKDVATVVALAEVSTGLCSGGGGALLDIAVQVCVGQRHTLEGGRGDGAGYSARCGARLQALEHCGIAFAGSLGHSCSGRLGFPAGGCRGASPIVGAGGCRHCLGGK